MVSSILPWNVAAEVVQRARGRQSQGWSCFKPLSEPQRNLFWLEILQETQKASYHPVMCLSFILMLSADILVDFPRQKCLSKSVYHLLSGPFPQSPASWCPQRLVSTEKGEMVQVRLAWVRILILLLN
jgi:hypothetical protein